MFSAFFWFQTFFQLMAIENQPHDYELLNKTDYNDFFLLIFS